MGKPFVTPFPPPEEWCWGGSLNAVTIGKPEAATQLSQHRSIYAGEKHLERKVCGRAFARPYASQHPRTFKRKRPGESNYYGKSLGHRKHLTWCLRIHAEERPLGYCALKRKVSHSSLHRYH